MPQSPLIRWFGKPKRNPFPLVLVGGWAAVGLGLGLMLPVPINLLALCYCMAMLLPVRYRLTRPRASSADLHLIENQADRSVGLVQVSIKIPGEKPAIDSGAIHRDDEAIHFVGHSASFSLRYAKIDSSFIKWRKRAVPEKLTILTRDGGIPTELNFLPILSKYDPEGERILNILSEIAQVPRAYKSDAGIGFNPFTRVFDATSSPESNLTDMDSLVNGETTVVVQEIPTGESLLRKANLNPPADR